MNYQAANMGRFGAVANQSVDDRLTRRAREDKILEAQAKGAAVSGAMVAGFVPWGTFAAAGAELTALAFKVALALRKHGNLVLSGDANAIKGFIQRSKHWNAKKRERVATRLHKELVRLQAHATRKGMTAEPSDDMGGPEERAARKAARQAKRSAKHGHKGKVGDTLLIHIKSHQMKLAALLALEVESRKSKSTPLIAGESNTKPATVESDPNAGAPDESESAFVGSAPGGVPLTYWIAGGTALTVLGILLSRSGRSA